MIEAALEISNGLISAGEIKDILILGKQMLDAEVHVFDSAEKTLSELVADFPLMLITKGDPIEQKRKIIHSGLEKYFRHIEIVGEKTRDTYRVLFEKYNLQPGQILMVGNSLRSDILPVIQIGGQAVYVPYENTWAHEDIVGDRLKNYAYFEIEKLEDLRDLVSSLNSKHS
jgi:putative hydrolase of the HAD superfamily